MDDEDTLARELAEGIYTDFDKYTLMDMEFLVSDLVAFCAENPEAHEKFNKLVALRRERSHSPESEGKWEGKG